MRILVSGASGLVGRALVAAWERRGDSVFRLVRRSARSEHEVEWSLAERRVDRQRLRDLDAVVHLAGESVFAPRWTAAKKKRIRDSRVVGTGLLAETLAALSPPPKRWLCASAVGYYGDHGTEWVTEETGPGSGFLAETCVAWEAAAEPARNAGVSVRHARLGVVLSDRGGALATMLPVFRLGFGGRLGSGEQYMSWIHLDDVVAAITKLVDDDGLAGPFNLVAPHPVPNREFSDTLGRILRRPAILPVPSAVLRLLGGEMAREVLLPSIRVRPHRLLEAGFAFSHAELSGALRDLLPRAPRDRGP
ncbi:MAG: TIGR01777 family oxidoreductase [Planctomycetota bacterium]